MKEETYYKVFCGFNMDTNSILYGEPIYKYFKSSTKALGCRRRCGREIYEVKIRKVS